MKLTRVIITLQTATVSLTYNPPSEDIELALCTSTSLQEKIDEFQRRGYTASYEVSRIFGFDQVVFSKPFLQLVNN